LCVGAAFERKAGSPFLNCFPVSLLKKIELFKHQVNNNSNKLYLPMYGY